MDRLGRTAFVEIRTTGLDVDRAASLGRHDMGAASIARRNDPAAALDLIVHCRKPKTAGCANEPSERRASDRAGVLWMCDRGAQGLGIAQERHLLSAAGKQIGCTRFAQGTEAGDVADCLYAADNLFADGGRDVGVLALALLETLRLLDKDFGKQMLTRINAAPPKRRVLRRR
jgi:hypothetical protein